MFRNQEEFRKQQEAEAARKKLVNSCLGSFESAKNSENYVQKMMLMMTITPTPPSSCPHSTSGTVEAQGAQKTSGFPSQKKATKKKKSSPRLVPYSHKHTADEITINEAQRLGLGFGLEHSYKRRKTFHITTNRNRILLEIQ